jgi:predicted membrane channel-forming protein YqfA (hemolysin III family)
MRQARRWFRTGLEYCGVFVLVAVVLPCVALAGFLLRGVLLVAAIVAIVGAAVLLCVSSRFRDWAARTVCGATDPAHPSRAGSRS